jgi:hypothetical protein
MERVDADLVPFAQNNPSGYRFAFGTDTATDDINVNYNDNIKKGWGTTPNEFPEVEDFNALAYTSGYLTSYLYQMGISEWNNKQKYRQYSRVIGSDGKIYKAKTGTDLAPNVNLNPTTDSVNWEKDNQFEINSLTAKTTPADADNFVVSDSAASHVLKKTTWANIKTAILSSFGVMINTATAKTTPEDNDIFIIADSTSSNATKKTTWENIKATLLTYFDTLYSRTAAIFGIGQTWLDVTASRVIGTTYTNTTGKPILISFGGSASSSPSPNNISIKVGTTTVAATANSFSNGSLYQGYTKNLTTIVPHNATYSYNTSTALSSFIIRELR